MCHLIFRLEWLHWYACGKSLCGWLRCFTLAPMAFWWLRLCWKFSSPLDCVRALKLTRVFLFFSAGRFWAETGWCCALLCVELCCCCFCCCSTGGAKYLTVSVVSWAIFLANVWRELGYFVSIFRCGCYELSVASRFHTAAADFSVLIGSAEKYLQC